MNLAPLLPDFLAFVMVHFLQKCFEVLITTLRPKNRTEGGYEDFEAFLEEMNHHKRKKIRQERRKVHAAGINFQWLSGYDVSEDHWCFFIDCYNKTYHQHRSKPY